MSLNRLSTVGGQDQSYFMLDDFVVTMQHEGYLQGS